jgi:hypothetical protein
VNPKYPIHKMMVAVAIECFMSGSPHSVVTHLYGTIYAADRDTADLAIRRLVVLVILEHSQSDGMLTYDRSSCGGPSRIPV